jgi:putative MATE family efflux protein
MATPETSPTTASPASPAAPARTRRLLEGPIGPTLAALAAPNVVVSAAQMAVAIADAWYVGFLGVAPLAALALVFPVQSLMTMMSAGAMGGGISSAMARALGAGNRERAESIALHALIIAAGMAALFTIVFALFARPLFAVLGGREAALDGAVAYAQVMFGGAIVVWAANTLASLLRGTGNMAVPGIVFTATAILNIALSGTLTLGWLGAPRLGVAGPAVAAIVSFGVAALVMLAYLSAGRSGVRLRLLDVKLEPAIFLDILKVGLVACGNALLTITTIIIVTGLVGLYGTAALAGYGLGSRLELLLIPITFSVGGAMTAMVGANRGAKAHARVRQIGWTGGLAAFVITGVIGLTVAIAPDLWIGLFTADAEAAAVARRYLAIAGPFFAFFGLGQALYFATQGTGNMSAPFAAGCMRLAVAGGLGALVVLVLGLSLTWLFVCVAAGFVVFGGMLAYAVWRGRTWNPDRYGAKA